MSTFTQAITSTINSNKVITAITTAGISTLLSYEAYIAYVEYNSLTSQALRFIGM